MLESSKVKYCHPCLLVTTSCLPKVQLQRSGNTFLPLSALIFCLILYILVLALLCSHLSKLQKAVYGGSKRIKLVDRAKEIIQLLTNVKPLTK